MCRCSCVESGTIVSWFAALMSRFHHPVKAIHLNLLLSSQAGLDLSVSQPRGKVLHTRRTSAQRQDDILAVIYSKGWLVLGWIEACKATLDFTGVFGMFLVLQFVLFH